MKVFPKRKEEQKGRRGRNKNNQEQANKRLNEALADVVWDEKSQKEKDQRVKALLGNLEQPRLGWTSTQYNQLAEIIDVIYHSGAFVHHLKPYNAMKTVNVDSTKIILHFALQHQVKAIHYISSQLAITRDMNIYSHDSKKFPKVLEETPLATKGIGTRPGYGRSKWVSEVLLNEAGNRGLPVSIWRMGLIASHSRSGVSSVGDSWLRFLRSIIDLNCWPIRSPQSRISATPVDYASKAIIYATLHPNFYKYQAHRAEENKKKTEKDQKPRTHVTYHILSPKHSWSLEEYCKVLIDIGYKKMKGEELNSFKDKVRAKGKSTPIYPLIEGLVYHRIEPSHYLDTTHFNKVTEGCEGLEELDLTADAIKNQIHWLIQRGYIPAPETQSSKL